MVDEFYLSIRAIWFFLAIGALLSTVFFVLGLYVKRDGLLSQLSYWWFIQVGWMLGLGAAGFLMVGMSILHHIGIVT